MSELIPAVNSMGRAFCEYAGSMFLQTAVLVAILLCADLLLRNRIRATLRYWIWMIVFVKLLLPPSLCIPTGIGYWLGGRTVPAALPQAVEESQTPVGVAVGVPADLPSQASHPVPSAVEPIGADAIDSTPLTWQGGFFLLWIVGVLAFAGLVIQRWRFVKELIAQGEPAPDELVGVLDQCRRRMGIRRSVGLRLSPNTFSPAVCGLLGPTILVPRALLARLSPGGLEAVVIHELAHVRRGDLWANSLQTVLQVVYFYNPLVWLANAIVRRVREQAVDEMALVALGAEARSYGNTLIDIAEMAFLRVSPALRLIGVAESRKSLEGRIKHMMTRPMPKSARVGTWGALSILVIAAVLLPMATADTETAKPQFTANLPNGVTVELVGVCNWPQGEAVCWKADGSALDTLMCLPKQVSRADSDRYGFMLRVSGPEDIDVQWNSIEGADSRDGSLAVVNAQGIRIDRHAAVMVPLKAEMTRTTLRVDVAAGSWTTISRHDGQRMSRSGPATVLWSQAFEDADGISVVATAEWRKDRAERIVAVDGEGVTHVSRGGSVAAGNMDQMTTHFDGLKKSQLREFQYQVRPYEWVEFKDVSLRSGRGTVPHVQWGRVVEQSAAPAETRPDDQDQAARAKSAEILRNLIRAALIWSNEHDDKLPDSVANLEDELDPADKEWLLKNVAYPGKDLSLRDTPAGHVIAYDKTLLAQGDGTNVLYMDTHVAFEKPDVLKRLGITAATAGSDSGQIFRSYEVNRSVADFPPGEDLSTPEAAYATINRMDQDDSSAWKRVSVARLVDRFGPDSDRKRTAYPEWTKVLAGARIRGVLVWNMAHAAVIAELPQGSSGKEVVDPIDRRSFQLENGRWLNTGNSRFKTIEEAKAQFMGWMQRETAQADAMRDPLQHAAQIKAVAAQLFEQLRTADYAGILSYYRNGRWVQDGWKKLPISYTVHTDYPSFTLWCCTHFKDNPIIDVQLGDVFIGDTLIMDKTGWPTVPYKLTLKDGATLAGNLPFEYEIYKGQGRWNAVIGIDWHLWPR